MKLGLLHRHDETADERVGAAPPPHVPVARDVIGEIGLLLIAHLGVTLAIMAILVVLGIGAD